MSLLCLGQVFAQPDWSAPTFENNMAVRTSLIDACNSVGDIIAVFSKSSGEIRGVSDPITTSDTLLITVFSTTSTGEEMIFKLYDNESDAIFDIADVAFSFEKGSVLGLGVPIVIPGRESVPPLMMCKSKIVYLDENGAASIVVDDIDDGSTDNCVIASRALSRLDFSCADLGDQIVTLTIIDPYDNSSSCDASVTIIDTLAPVIVCKNKNVELSENGTATIMASDVDDDTTDNCGIASREINKSSFSKHEDRVQLIMLTITDDADLISKCTAQITIINNFENDIINCSDGVDNDNDGMVDCADPDCSKPLITEVSSVDPDPINCTETLPNGSITITATGADLYSIDGGASTLTTGMFSNIVGADYNVWVQNAETGCITSEDLTLNNTLDPLWDVTEFMIEGPRKLCSGLSDVTYSIDVKEDFVNVTWSSLTSDVISTSNGSESKLDFGKVESGYLRASVQGVCMTIVDSILITPALEEFCNITNCQTDLFLSNEIIGTVGETDVYRAQLYLTTNAQYEMGHKELTAGQHLLFLSGFEVGPGTSLIADIKPCGE